MTTLVDHNFLLPNNLRNSLSSKPTTYVAHVDIVTEFHTHHRQTYILTIVNESGERETASIRSGTGQANEILIRLLQSENSEGFQSGITKSMEQIDVPQRLGTIEIHEEYFRELQRI